MDEFEKLTENFDTVFEDETAAESFDTQTETEFEQDVPQNSEENTDEKFDDINHDNISDNDFEDAPTDIPIVLQNGNTDQKKNSKGLTVFIIVLCIVIALSGAVAAGYYIGKNRSDFKNKESHNVELEEKPKTDEKMDAAGVYKAVNPSVVGIAVYDSAGIKCYASGVVYSEDGYIITDDHIYAEVPGAKFRVYTYDSKAYDAKFVAGDTRTDLAVLKIDSDGFYPATFGNSDDLTCGETVYAIGKPNDHDATASITQGCVSFLNIRVANFTNYSERFIQTDAAINPGSSGGALANAYGQVVGITSGKRSGEEYEGIGYAIPTTTVKRIVESLIENHEVINRAKLGITYQFIDDVAAISQNTPIGLSIADASGNEELAKQVKEGDIITKVNDIEVTTDEVVLNIIEESRPGDTLKLTVYTTDGTTKTINAKLLADKSSSSYKSGNSKAEGNKDKDNNSSLPEAGSGGTFDFPFGY